MKNFILYTHKCAYYNIIHTLHINDIYFMGEKNAKRKNIHTQLKSHNNTPSLMTIRMAIVMNRCDLNDITSHLHL